MVAVGRGEGVGFGKSVTVLQAMARRMVNAIKMTRL
jgi:hypothetical protein